MPYCPKCGVEVENDVLNCPLCDFPVPDVDGSRSKGVSKYPRAVNTYMQDHLAKKNIAFFTVLIIGISVLIILGIIELIYSDAHPVIGYLAVGDVAIVALVFFALGYLKIWFNLLGAYITVILAALAIYFLIGNESGWFFNFAFPIVTLLFLDIYIFVFVFRTTRHRNRFIFIPTNIILFAIVFSLGIDGIISYHFEGWIHLTWSLIVAVSGGAIIVILQGLYIKLPEKTKQMLNKKLHM